MSRRFVCVCNFITEKEIKEAIKMGASTLDDIKELTSAGTTCGKCHAAIKNLLREATEDQKKNPQRTLF